jgi:hypothetical protein
MTHDPTTDAVIVDAVRDLLCEHGWGHEQAHGPPGLASEEIPGRVADVIGEVERRREEACDLHAQFDEAGVEDEDVVYHDCGDEEESGGYMVEHVTLTLSQRVASSLLELERLRARVAELEAERWPIPGTEGDEQYTARALLGRVVRVCAGRAKRYLRPRAQDRPALTVGEVTSLGSGYSAALCHAYGYDPDTGAELRPGVTDV